MFISVLDASARPHLHSLSVCGALKYVHKFLDAPFKQQTPPLELCGLGDSPLTNRKMAEVIAEVKLQRIGVVIFYWHVTNDHEFVLINTTLLSHSSIGLLHGASQG